MKNFKRDYVLDQESSFCTLQPKKDTCKGEEFKEGNLSSLFTLGKLKELLLYQLFHKFHICSQVTPEGPWQKREALNMSWLELYLGVQTNALNKATKMFRFTISQRGLKAQHNETVKQFAHVNYFVMRRGVVPFILVAAV